ncbi:MAG TPA: AarF/UbiB family protein [Opitutaceae bacterium]|nr:AarF/UbiB family protein [Opitutaceae bacterium]
MKLSAKHLKRYREIASLLWKYGRSDLVQQMNADEDLIPEAKEKAKENDSNHAEDAKESGAPRLDKSAGTVAAEAEAAHEATRNHHGKKNGKVTPEGLVDDLEAMGPTYVKLGQVLAGRPDLMPEVYRNSLARLQDKVKPFPYEQVEEIVEKELGVRISKAFASFDREPLAAASLGQVHHATLRDGRPVVVKVQRPDIRPQIAEDFEVLEQLAGTVDSHTKLGRRHRFSAILEEFRLTIQHELNYEREAQNLITLGRNLQQFERIQVPQPVLDYTTRNILTMEFVTGQKITSLTPLARLEINGSDLCEELFRAYLKQVLVDGIFHADPHPGNVFLTDEGRVALLDLGMVGHTAPKMQENLLKLLLAVSDGDSDGVANLVIQISEKTEEFDPSEFKRKISQLVAQTRDQGLAQIKVGKSILEVTKNAGENGLYVPSELTLLGKTLLQLDEIGRILAPDWDPNASVRRNVDEFMTQRMKKDISKGNILSSMLEMKEFVGGLPNRLNRIMDTVTNNELEVKVKSVDAKVVMEGMQKIANRITTGVILASLVIGASLLMRVETRFQLWGYPGLAILCFVGAAAGGAWLVANIFIQDYKDKKKIKTRN